LKKHGSKNNSNPGKDSTQTGEIRAFGRRVDTEKHLMKYFRSNSGYVNLDEVESQKQENMEVLTHIESQSPCGF
jgi:hypothetical protein